jgi:aryl-alcohol dehydrogenase-like predicted oxidoreductase
MKYRKLGNTGFSTGEVGLGCWQFGGDFGPMEENTAFEIMSTAVENGINFFDTADVYGNGRSESLIGRFLSTSKNKIFVATKFGRGGGVYPDKYTERALCQAMEASLKRLNVEALDLTQLHCVPIDILRDGEIFQWLSKLKQEGEIKNFGASVETIEEAMLCLEKSDVSSLQIIFNIFRQKPIQELLPKAKEKNVAIIVRLPLASGLLAGKFTKETKFAETDHRNYNRDGKYFNVGETFAGLPFEKGVELSGLLKPLVPQEMTMAQMAIRWILDYEAVSVVIPGASSPKQAQSNAKASGLPPLSKELHKKLSEIYMKEVHKYIRGPY